MGNGLFHCNGSLLLLARALKVPDLIRQRDVSLLRSVVTLLLAGSGVLHLAAPGSSTGLNAPPLSVSAFRRRRG